MRRSDLCDAVKRGVTAAELVRSWGINVDRNGMCKCPLHGEKTASMKCYPGDRGFYCFGCHAGGSVINLAMLYYGLDLDGAIELLNSDFNLGLPVGRPATREQEEAARRRAEQRAKEKREREKAEQRRADAYTRYLDISDRIRRLENDMKDYAPKPDDETWDERFVTAMKELDGLKRQADDLAIVAFDKDGYFEKGEKHD